MRKSLQAVETLSIERAESTIEDRVTWVADVVARLRPMLSEGQSMRVLDIGCAQGRSLIGLSRLGFDAYGVEPSEQARATALELSAQMNITLNIREGSAESIPFKDEFFDIVLAMSVMEHVQDLERSLREIFRVLKPGGLFWFYSASSMCPVQGEIRGFPLFGWYPDKWKQRIMIYARDRNPSLVGYTTAPAIHWWTPWKARRKLMETGFCEVWDRWDLKDTETQSGFKSWFVRLAKRVKLLRLVGDVCIPDCSFAARKPNALL